MGDALQKQHTSIRMYAELCRCPLTGQDVLAYEGQVGLVAQHIEDAKLSLHFMLKVAINLG